MEALFEILFVVISLVIYVVSSLGKGKKKTITVPPQRKTIISTNPNENSQKKTFSVEDFIKELESKNQEQSSYRDFGKEDTVFESNTFENAETFQEKGAFNKDIEAELEEKFDFNSKFGGFKPIKEIKKANIQEEEVSFIASLKKAKPKKLSIDEAKSQAKVVYESPYLKLFKDASTLRNAFIMGELLNRKY